MATDVGKRTLETTELSRKIPIGVFFQLSVVYSTVADIIRKEFITLHCMNLKCETALCIYFTKKGKRLTADLNDTFDLTVFSLTEKPQITAVRNTHFLAH